MPDWTYHTVLRPIVPRLPRALLRGWGASRIGRRVVAWLADAPADPRLTARVGPDAEGIARELGVGAVARAGDALADPTEAARRVRAEGAALLDLAAGGPGLPRRVHEAVTPAARGRLRWGSLLLGLGMIAAGAGAWLVAATRVVLPYDEAFVEVPRALLPFLAHDRMTLAGTMLSIGILYAALALGAPGARWARRAIVASATVGFANFFLFLAFGYFDPLHAAVSAALFPLFVWGAWGRPDGTAHQRMQDERNDRVWRRAQWGTLGMIAVGFGLAVGGLTIAVVGSTRVFVASDLAFIGDVEVGPRLAALVAHDRAGFGGALVSHGILVMLASMWGIRRGAAWLWWSYLLAGGVGFGSTLGVHVVVGYTDAMHLAPVLLALVLFVASLGALREYMCSAHERLDGHA